MNAQTAKEIFDSYGESLYEGYSGRGMFGAKTTGVVIGKDHLRSAALLKWEIELGEDFDQARAEDWYDNKGLRPYKIDNMGKDYIIY